MKQTLIRVQLLVLFVLLAACDQVAVTSQPAIPETEVVEQVEASAERKPTFTSLAEPTDTPSADEPASCETHMAAVELQSPERVQVGETLIVMVTLNNTGCSGLGIPQIRLAVTTVDELVLFDPAVPEALTPGGVVGMGQGLTVAFELLATDTGQATLKAFANFEVILGSSGPFYWGSATPSAEITVNVE